jgi:hypothetical protein
MARVQEESKSDCDPSLSSSAQGSDTTDHDTAHNPSTAKKRRGGTCLGSLPPSHPASGGEVVNPTVATVVQEGPTRGWVVGLKCHNRPAPDPKDADDAEYTAENEDDIEMGASDTSRAKSARIGKQSKQAKVPAKLTQKDM